MSTAAHPRLRRPTTQLPLDNKAVACKPVASAHPDPALPALAGEELLGCVLELFAVTLAALLCSLFESRCWLRMIGSFRLGPPGAGRQAPRQHAEDVPPSGAPTRDRREPGQTAQMLRLGHCLKRLAGADDRRPGAASRQRRPSILIWRC